jgi:peptide deformylase
MTSGRRVACQLPESSMSPSQRPGANGAMERVLAHPNAALKQHAAQVDPLSESDLGPLCARMGEAMYQAPGVGLAAPQIGVLKRVIVYDLDDGAGLVSLCNPRIVQISEEKVLDEEGCLSLPGISVPVERAAVVVCEAQTLLGEAVRLEASDFHARLLQHEIDHLDGILIIDRAAPEDRKAAIRRYLDLAAGQE